MASPKNYVTPSHVLYANDLMVFCKANANNIKSLFSFFKDYEAISGWVLANVAFMQEVSQEQGLVSHLLY